MMFWATALGVPSLVFGFIAWACVHVGARAEREFDEAQLEAALEGALIAELSDHSFVGAGK